MHTAALMARTLQRLGQRRDQAGVLVGDHQLHAAETASAQRAQEPAPERLVLGVADVAAQDLPVAVGGDAGGDDDGHRHDLRGLVADVQVGGVQVHIGNST